MGESFRRLFTWWTRRYTRSVCINELDGVWVHIDPAALQALRGGRVVCAANHVNWFDGFVAHWASWDHGLRPLIVTDKPTWDRFGFMEGFGCVPIRKDEPREAYQDLQAIGRRIREEGGAVWIFPQGEHTPTHLRPLRAYKGVAALAEAADAPVLPVTLSYVYRSEPRPAALMHIGAPLQAEVQAHHALPQAWEEGLDTHTGWYRHGLTEPTLAPRQRSTLPERALSWAWRTFS